MRISDWSSDVCSSDLTLANTAVITPSNGTPVTVDTSGPVITDQSLPKDPAMPARDGDAGLPGQRGPLPTTGMELPLALAAAMGLGGLALAAIDRKSTRLNSSH